MPQPNWIKSAWGWASAIPHHFTAPASRGFPASRLTGTPPFPDVDSSHWASDYIQTLANLGIISGFPDGSFRPDAPVTRAQFAAILRNAFPAPPFPTKVDLRNVKPFSDVAPSYWATSAISTTRATGFLSGYPGNRFRPEQNIPRIQALVALANGLNYPESRLTATPDRDLLSYYQDADQIPAYALPSLAAATDLSLVVNYPELRQLNPNRNASRAEIAALVYQALLQEGRARPLALNPHRVIATALPWTPEPVTSLPIRARQLSFSGPGTRLATLNPAGNLLQIWQSETGALVRSFNALGGTTFDAIALSEDGEQAIALGQTVSGPGHPTPTVTLQAWQIATGQSLWQQSFEPNLLAKVAGATQLNPPLSLQLLIRPRHNEVLTRVSFAVAPTDDPPVPPELRLHSLETGAVRQTLTTSPGGEYSQFAFSPRGGHLAALATAPSDRQSIRLWRLSDGSSLPSIALPAASPAYFALAFTPNGTLRALAQDLYDIRLDTWEVASQRLLERVTQLPQGDRQDSLGRLSPDGVTYFARSDGAGSRLIQTQLAGATPLETLADQAVFSGKGDWLAIATPNDVRIFVQTQPSSPQNSP